MKQDQPSAADVAAVKAYLMDLQDRICSALAAADGREQFSEDAWERPGGGGGRSRIVTDGALLEKDGTVSAEIAADVVVWNPHVNKAKAMGDFDDDGWTAMACVEPGVLAADRPGIAPNGSLVLSQTIAPED